MTTRRRLIEVLADGEIHAGPELGCLLEVSRSAVWKAVRQLEDLGLEIETRIGHGYRLTAPIEPLRAEDIRANLSTRARELIGQLHLFDELPSTNDWLRTTRSRMPSGSLCLAEVQTAGRGRRGRPWVALPYRSLCLSLYWHSERDPAGLGGLSLAVATSAVRALEGCGAAGLSIKWPNDIVALGPEPGPDPGRKLGGILTELDATSGGPSHLIIGLGLNLHLPHSVRRRIDQPVAALDELLAAHLPRNLVAARLVSGLLEGLEAYEDRGLAAFAEDWQRLDCVRDRDITVQGADGLLHGRAAGVDGQDGALLLETPTGLLRLHSGEVSLKAAS